MNTYRVKNAQTTNSAAAATSSRQSVRAVRCVHKPRD